MSSNCLVILLFYLTGALYPAAFDDPGSLGLQLPFEPPSSLTSTHPWWDSIDLINTSLPQSFIKDWNCHWPRPKLYLFIYKLIEVLFQKRTMFFLYQYVLRSLTRGNHPPVEISSGFHKMSNSFEFPCFCPQFQITKLLPGFGLLPSTGREIINTCAMFALKTWNQTMELKYTLFCSHFLSPTLFSSLLFPPNMGLMQAL